MNMNKKTKKLLELLINQSPCCGAEIRLYHFEREKVVRYCSKCQELCFEPEPEQEWHCNCDICEGRV